MGSSTTQNNQDLHSSRGKQYSCCCCCCCYYYQHLLTILFPEGLPKTRCPGTAKFRDISPTLVALLTKLWSTTFQHHTCMLDTAKWHSHQM